MRWNEPETEPRAIGSAATRRDEIREFSLKSSETIADVTAWTLTEFYLSVKGQALTDRHLHPKLMLVLYGDSVPDPYGLTGSQNRGRCQWRTQMDLTSSTAVPRSAWRCARIRTTRIGRGGFARSCC